MNYKQQIEQKAREYADEQEKISDELTYGYADLVYSFKAGAEAMREIANMWILLSG